MSIVERAADKLRQTAPETASEAAQRTDGAAPHKVALRDHVEAAGRRQSKQAQAEPRPKLVIDFAKLHRAGLVPPASAEAMVARQFQRIKRPLISNATEVNGVGIANGNRFMVASAIPGEGKTFTSVNLALSLAKERDYSVVLVDGDVIKPSISRALGLQDAKGLTDILADDTVSFGNTVYGTNVPRLSVLPAGQRQDSATELLASRRMTWLMGELGRVPNRLIVFDSAPLLATAEAQAMAMAVGQILLVVRAGKTPRDAVEAALSLVDTADKSVSLILNQSTKAQGDYYAGYYGGYYDGQSARA